MTNHVDSSLLLRPDGESPASSAEGPTPKIRSLSSALMSKRLNPYRREFYKKKNISEI